LPCSPSCCPAPVSVADRNAIEQVLHDYPVRLSMHVVRQMRLSAAVAMQYLPFVDELDREGQSHTWVGQFHRGVLEQMYRNRLIFVLNMKCPVYCRFCFRKHKECRNQKTPTQAHVKQALAYIREAPDVHEVVLTGGDPFMNRPTLAMAIDGISTISHVKTLRAATRSLAYYPHLFRADGGRWLDFLYRKHLELRDKGKRLEVATHFIHPDEVSVEGLTAIAELVGHGIPVYVQTPLLKDGNDGGDALVELYGLLRSVGAEIHYIFMPCSPILGNRRYWATLSRGLDVARYLRAHLSDRAIPHITTATAIGKMDWGTSGWAVEVDREDERYVWLRTPYTKEYFEPFAPLLQLGDGVRDNDEGTLDCRFHAAVGDPALLQGSRRVVMAPTPSRDDEQGRQLLDAARQHALTDQRSRFSIVPTGVAGVARHHETRVEITPSSESLADAVAYVAAARRVSDVLVAFRGDMVAHLSEVVELVERLHGIPHVTAVRLRSLDFNYHPERYSDSVVRRLLRCNRLDPAGPTRVEVETRFLHGAEFRPDHERLAGVLRNGGVTVYAETPVLVGVNDGPEDMVAIAHGCRHAGIEFTTVYVAGHTVQRGWECFDLSRFVDMASRVRLFGSGREVPRYLIRTPLGDVDYGISAGLAPGDDDDGVLVTLRPYRRGYFRRLCPEFHLPAGATVDDDGVVTIPVGGARLLAPGDIGG